MSIHAASSANRAARSLRASTLPVTLLVFFLSGFAALLYQVIWQRLLVIFSGADVYSVTIIVAAFMVGLGLGSLAGGRLADRIGARACLWGFALAELGIGVFGLLSKWLYYDLLYLGFPYLAATPSVAAAVLLASLLWPTVLMGLSLPLLARALTASLGMTGRVIGSLYGWNALGAAAGALVGTWVLLPLFGLERSLWIAAAVSFACAGSAFLLRSERHRRDTVRRVPGRQGRHAGAIDRRTAVVPGMGIRLRSQRFYRVGVRDFMVPSARRHAQAHRLYVRNASWGLPLWSRAGGGAGIATRRSKRAARHHLSSASVRRRAVRRFIDCDPSCAPLPPDTRSSLCAIWEATKPSMCRAPSRCSSPLATRAR